MKKQLLTFLILIFAGVSAFSQEAKLVDKFGILQCDDYLSRIEVPMTTTINNPSSVMYVLVYEGKEGAGSKSALPTFGLAKARIRSIEKLLALRKVPVERFKFIQAGFRETFTVEFWLVPKGAAPPKPTPTLTKMKYRRGIPKGYCYCFECE